jgi:CRP-like cAMP-binding protein
MLGQRIELLGGLPIFRGLSKRQLTRILDVTVKAYFEPGEALSVRDCPGNAAFLILSGIAKCADFPGNPQAAGQLGAGCLIGETAMLTETAYLLTVEAQTRLRALAFERDAMRWAMECDPSIAERISNNLLERLHGFATDLRRLDNFLAVIEQDAPMIYSTRSLPGPGAAFAAQAVPLAS